MFRLFLSLIKKGVKNKIVNPFKAATNFIKNPLKSTKKRLTSSVRIIKNQEKKFKRIKRRIVLTVSPKARLIEETFKLAKISAAVIEQENVWLAKKTSASRDINETTKAIEESKRFLYGRSIDEIKAMNQTIVNELGSVRLKTAEQINRVVEDEEFRKDIIQNNAYETFMDNWKDGFYGYTPEELGMSLEERDLVWQQIEEQRTFADFIERKLN